MRRGNARWGGDDVEDAYVFRSSTLTFIPLSFLAFNHALPCWTRAMALGDPLDNPCLALCSVRSIHLFPCLQSLQHFRHYRLAVSAFLSSWRCTTTIYCSKRGLIDELLWTIQINDISIVKSHCVPPFQSVCV